MCEETVGKNFQEIHSLLWLSNGSFGVNAPNLKPKNQTAVDFFFFITVGGSWRTQRETCSDAGRKHANSILRGAWLESNPQPFDCEVAVRTPAPCAKYTLDLSPNLYSAPVAKTTRRNPDMISCDFYWTPLPKSCQSRC